MLGFEMNLMILLLVVEGEPSETITDDENKHMTYVSLAYLYPNKYYAQPWGSGYFLFNKHNRRHGTQTDS